MGKKGPITKEEYECLRNDVSFKKIFWIIATENIIFLLSTVENWFNLQLRPDFEFNPIFLLLSSFLYHIYGNKEHKQILSHEIYYNPSIFWQVTYIKYH